MVTSIFAFIATVYEFTAHRPSKKSANSPGRHSLPTSLSLHNGTVHKVFNEKQLELHQIQHAVNNNLSIDLEMEGAQKVKCSMNDTNDQNESKQSIGKSIHSNFIFEI